MSDDTRQVGGQDRARINMTEEYEVRDWMHSLGVSREVLADAVAAVGDRTDEVRAYLASNKA